jgi:hypothetical protein
MVSRVRATAILCIAALVVSVAAGCSNAPKTALERWSEARQLAADLLVQFIRTSDAANRAVMADTDEASAAFAREAEQATMAVQRETDALRPILQGLGYSEERRLLEEFGSRFAEYRALDRIVLEMAVENTNLKAQRLSFTAAQEAADALGPLSRPSSHQPWRTIGASKRSAPQPWRLCAKFKCCRRHTSPNQTRER